jgi:hypothetical protein
MNMSEQLKSRDSGLMDGIKMIFSGLAFVIIGRNVKKMAVQTQAA